MQIFEKNRVIDDIIFGTSHGVIDCLLKDMTTGENILWATDDYVQLGNEYAKSAPILSCLITDENAGLIKSRTGKSQIEQTARISENAEVFTPAWICNAQNNLIDDAWFGYKGAFNTERERGWTTPVRSVRFSSDIGKTWQDYVCLTCLEPACGEAPYLVSRYDAVTGDVIDIKDRIGRLDRKIRVINENVDRDDKRGWMDWIGKAYKSVYGYELQGDSLFIARKNLLYTFVEYYNDRFNEDPDMDALLEISEIIVWNVWQMDGLKGVVPYSCKDEVVVFNNLLGDETTITNKCPGCERNDFFRHNGVYCKIMNWETNKEERYIDNLSRRK